MPNAGMNKRGPGFDDYETPTSLYKEVDREFHFTLDACATAANAKTGRFFSVDDDGLAQSWAGHRVWVNPPYSQIELWTAKAVAERTQATIVMLLPVRTDTDWFHRDVVPYGEIRWLRSRVRFLKNGVVDRSPRFASMLVIFRGTGSGHFYGT